jgi:hypothetical protein
MASYNKFNSFTESLSEKVHNLGADQLMVALSNVAPVAGNSVLTDITQIAYTNLSSRVITTLSSAQASGTYKLVLQDLTLTSTGGSTGPFRYVVIYNNTATNDELICWFDYGVAGVTLADGESFLIDFDGTNGLLQNT